MYMSDFSRPDGAKALCVHLPLLASCPGTGILTPAPVPASFPYQPCTIVHPGYTSRAGDATKYSSHHAEPVRSIRRGEAGKRERSRAKEAHGISSAICSTQPIWSINPRQTLRNAGRTISPLARLCRIKSCLPILCSPVPLTG